MRKTSSIGTSTSSLQAQEPVTNAVINAVADEEGVSPLELEPIASVIDPDALNTFFAHGRTDTTVEFTYHEYRVSVTGDDQVTVTALDS